MRVIKNDALIKRNGRIGQWTSLAALAVLGLGMYLSFQRPDLFAYSIGALILGFTMTQVGMYFSNRWGKSPRPDETLDAGLKGLPGDAILYHYATPVPHLLVGPMGAWILLPYHQRGRLTFQNKRWRIKGGGFMQSYMTIFGQEGIGRPDLEALNQSQALQKYFAASIDESSIPPINVVLVLTSEKAEIDATDTPFPAVHVKKLKEFLRRISKGDAPRPEMIRTVQELLPQH
jgi:hypothetical protein